MYVAYHDNEQVALETDRVEAVTRLLEQMQADVLHVKINPEFLTAQVEGNKPFSHYDTDLQQLHLREVLEDHAPIERIARESVLAELELIAQEDPEDTPDDVHPTDSDRHIVELREWFIEHVETEQFDSEVWDHVNGKLHERLSSKISTLWQEITERKGNPAQLFPTHIRDEIARLEDQ